MKLTRNIIFVLLYCCGDHVQNPSIKFIAGLAYDSVTTELFSGEYVDYYPTGQKRGQYSYHMGVKLGHWQTFGYSGELIQQGEYISVNSILSPELLDRVKCNRIEVNKWKEGTSEFLDIYLINCKDTTTKVVALLEDKFYEQFNTTPVIHYLNY